MLFKTKEELDNYLAVMMREIEERLDYELMEEKGMTDMREVARLIQTRTSSIQQNHRRNG